MPPTRIAKMTPLVHRRAPSPLAGEGWGEGETVLVPGVSELTKSPPHPVPLPRWGEGINSGGGAK